MRAAWQKGVKWLAMSSIIVSFCLAGVGHCLRLLGYALSEGGNYLAILADGVWDWGLGEDDE